VDESDAMQKSRNCWISHFVESLSMSMSAGVENWTKGSSTYRPARRRSKASDVISLKMIGSSSVPSMPGG